MEDRWEKFLDTDLGVALFAEEGVVYRGTGVKLTRAAHGITLTLETCETYVSETNWSGVHEAQKIYSLFSDATIEECGNNLIIRSRVANWLLFPTTKQFELDMLKEFHQRLCSNTTPS